MKEGWKVSGLDSFLTFFCESTVSFLEYFPKEEVAVFLDEPMRLKEKAETVEGEFRESMIHRLEKGYLLPEQTSLLYSSKETLAQVRLLLLFCDGVNEKLLGE